MNYVVFENKNKLILIQNLIDRNLNYLSFTVTRAQINKKLIIIYKFKIKYFYAQDQRVLSTRHGGREKLGSSKYANRARVESLVG